MPTPTYRLTLAYDGTAFAGYARQPDARTVEGTLRAALSAFHPKAWAVGGRTDRGVSAQGQVVSLRTAEPVAPVDLIRAVDAGAPGLVCCTHAEEVPRRFHAAFAAKTRRYAYLLPDEDQLDVERLDALVRALSGRRCFSAFARDTRPGQQTERRLLEAGVRRAHEGARRVLEFHFLADGFLRRQVRVMVSTAVRECLAGAPEDRLVELAASGDRRATAWPAAPEPLRLVSIGY